MDNWANNWMDEWADMHAKKDVNEKKSCIILKRPRIESCVHPPPYVMTT